MKVYVLYVFVLMCRRKGRQQSQVYLISLMVARFLFQENMNASSRKLVEDQEKKVEEFNVKIKLLEEKLKSEKVSSLKKVMLVRSLFLVFYSAVYYIGNHISSSVFFEVKPSFAWYLSNLVSRHSKNILISRNQLTSCGPSA